MTYKYVKDESGSVTDKYIERKADGAWIPFVAENTDYQEYLKWVEAGNTAEAAD